MKYSKSNPPMTCMMTQSTCYKGTKKMTVKGVLWHSTGANNPTLKRYVQPDDGAPDRAELLSKLGTNANKNDWNHIDTQAGLNAWIGKLADGSVAAVQTMPWDFRPWGCGSGSKGSCNSGWIQFEICEDALTDADYFAAVYQEACELTAYLCTLYGIDPKGTADCSGVTVPTILCHADSHKLKLGSNHADVTHWFPKFGKSMETARDDVAALMSGSTAPGTEDKTAIMGKAQATASQMAAFCLSKNASPQLPSCTVEELARMFIEEGEAEGVRGDVAFAQSLHETGYFKFGGIVLPSQNNYAGIGALNGNATGQAASFPDPRTGVRAQIQHLKAYASTEALVNACVDPRFSLVARGVAPYVEWLGAAKLKEQTAQIKDEAGRKVLEDALDDVVNLATVSVGAMEQTTAKALRDAVKSGKAKPEELAALGKQVFDEVKAAISPQAQQVITDNLGSFDKYLTAVIEDAVLKVKQADPYITLSGELAEGVELPAAGGTQ